MARKQRRISMSKFTVSNLAGAKLKEIRLSQGYKIHDIAVKLNKSDQQLFRYERGVNKIDLDTIINYLNILEIDFSSFFLELRLEMEMLKKNNSDTIQPSDLQNIKNSASFFNEKLRNY